ncbi:uncharacterized protein METZ01_LOCUS168787 [marine metagenome]|jgi:hypothetical protein|uniref:Baseplate wedge subunit n=1 Tax=marine metagenome TaxID=408172 RepID=A0A382BS85_9ZZZZ|tara:strand:- start:3516 stop:4094 length:579 start_codon:yes stop_codon:yes gene_type:complete
MSEFFSHYPKISYNVSGVREPTKLKIAVDIMNRTKIKDVLLDSIVQFQPYSIPENERPDVTAVKVYGDVKFTWLIFVMNEMHNPVWDWPLGTREFITYLEAKYGSVPFAQQGIHHYERTLRHRVEQKGPNDPIAEYKIACDFDTYTSLPDTDRGIVYYYDYETKINEAKRDIKLIKTKFASMIFTEHINKLL